MDKANEKILVRIAEALERLSPPGDVSGNLTEANSYLWKSNPDRLIPINKITNIRLDLLIGIAGAKKKILKNTTQFAKGYPANNVLLWGSRGTGKSSLVKSAYQVVASEFKVLKLIEIQREDIGSLDRLLVVLNNIEIDNRYIIFCDDLSFSREDKEYKTLKILLEGGLIEKPENVVFYSTSNRKHLISREMIENESARGISPTEAIEEKVSLSDRFGLVLGFYPCTQDQYLEMISLYRDTFNLPIDKEQMFKQAIEWQQIRGSRSGRVAWQYILNLAGTLEIPLELKSLN